MPRGWYRAPDGWWQRSSSGHRPKSQQSRQPAIPQSFQGQSVGTPPPLRQVSKPPEKIAADVVGEIERLQAAMAALGDLTALVKPLQEALRVAQARI